MDMPWAGKDESRKLFQLAAFAKRQSDAEGVIVVFVKGPDARLAWHLSPQMYPQLPQILRAERDAWVGQTLAMSADDPGVTPVSDDEVLEESYFERTSPGDIERILHKLPALSRAVLLLRCREGRTYEAIGEELDLPVSSVKKYMRGALITAALISRGVEEEPNGETPRVLFKLAKFAKDQSDAEGVILVFLKGHSRLAWYLPHRLYSEIPVILNAASKNAVEHIARLADDPGAALPAAVREQMREVVRRSRPN